MENGWMKKEKSQAEDNAGEESRQYLLVQS